MTYIYRKDWSARPARPGPGRLVAKYVEGAALHWPAMSKPLTTVEAVCAALRGWQDYHMDDLGWSDIGYQEAFDQAGNVYLLRGLRTQSGANGNEDVNERFGALLLILAPGEQPSAAMVKAVRRRIGRHRHIFPNSTLIVGHNEVRPEATACPGPIAQRLIRQGEFNPKGPR